jgi:hypothetical protein
VDEVVVLGLALPYFYLAPWWIVRRDMRKLRPEQLERCWPSSSLGAAIVAFGPFCLTVHFVRAHGWLKGMFQGLIWTVATALLPDLILLGASSLVG